jgi:hypothetical protein
MAATIEYRNDKVGVVVQKPNDWKAEPVNDYQFRLFSPPSAAHQSYRSTISYQLGEPERGDEQWFKQLIFNSALQMPEEYPFYKLLGQDNFQLQGRPAYIRRYEWQDSDTGFHFSQFQAFIYWDAENFYLINAATIKPLYATHMSALDSIFKSTRIILK